MNHPDHPTADPRYERTESLRAEVARLADLSEIDYEFERAEVASTYGIRPTALDRLVAAERRGKASSPHLRDDASWPEPVNLGALLDDVLALQRRYIAGNPVQIDVVPVWVAHAYLAHHRRVNLQISPRLAVQSADKNSGKTMLLNIVACLCPRAIMLSSASASGLYHMAQQRATIVLDEIDQLRHGSLLHHIMNGSHRRTDANVLRADFSAGAGSAKVSNAWCAMAVGGLGQLPPTLQSRCIVVNMRPAMAHDALELLEGEPAESVDLRRKFARWAADLTKLPQVELPPGIINRARDNWRILAQLAHLAGPEWVKRIERAALHAVQQERPSPTVALLQSVRRAFDGRDQITTRELLLKLLHDEEYADMFQTANRGRPVTECWLRERFPGLISNPDRSVKIHGGRGYTRVQFADAFRMYLEPMPEVNAPVQSQGQAQIAAPAQEIKLPGEPKKLKRKHKLKLVVSSDPDRKEVAEPAATVQATERYSSAPPAAAGLARNPSPSGREADGQGEIKV